MKELAFIGPLARAESIERDKRWKAYRLSRFQGWYTAFRERQKLRYDWIPLGDICKRLVETKGISTEEARREIVKLLRDGWFNRKVGRSGAWLIYLPATEIGRVGPRVVSDAEVNKSPDIASVWLNVVEQGGAINGELFESCWLPRDLVIRWCDNYSVSARPGWREAPTPLEFPASIFEGQWNHDIVRFRWLWFLQIGKRCGNPECKALPCFRPNRRGHGAGSKPANEQRVEKWMRPAIQRLLTANQKYPSTADVEREAKNALGMGYLRPTVRKVLTKLRAEWPPAQAKQGRRSRLD